MKKIDELRLLLGEAYFAMARGRRKGEVEEFYKNPTKSELETLGKEGTARHVLDFQKKVMYSWAGGVLHYEVFSYPAYAKVVEKFKLSDYCLVVSSVENEPTTLDIDVYFGKYGSLSLQLIPKKDLKEIAQMDWEWLNKYFTNVKKMKKEYVHDMKELDEE